MSQRKQGIKTDPSWFNSTTPADELQKHAALQSELKKILFPETPVEPTSKTFTE